MQVIPVINCGEFGCVKNRFAETKFIGSSWVHIDIADGKFTPVKTWNRPQELTSNFQPQTSNIQIEVHLMVQNPEVVAEDWLKAGVKRLIVHVETLRESSKTFDVLLSKCSEYNAELMLALNPETPVEDLLPFLDSLLFIQVLAVKPGPAGQEFNEKVLEKIQFIRERNPDVSIEVDGGINSETARLVKAAGADVIASASYIFGSKNPKEAFQELRKI